MKDQTIRLLIVDDHDIIRQGVIALLQFDDALQVVGQAGNGQEALRLVKALQPDVILLDIKMEDASGLDCIPALLQAKADLRIIMLTMYADEVFLHTALRAGASGYFLKGSDSKELARAIHAVMANELYLSPKLNQELVAMYHAKGGSATS